jgi:hypothetical protein
VDRATTPRMPWHDIGRPDPGVFNNCTLYSTKQEKETRARICKPFEEPRLASWYDNPF